MSLSQIYYEPFYSFGELQRLMDEAFNTHVSDPHDLPHHPMQPRPPKLLKPRMDVHEADSLVTVTFELPGLKKDDVNIDVHENRLVISGEVPENTEGTGGQYVVKERKRGSFGRTLVLPPNTMSEDIKANLENGVLTITFPRAIPVAPHPMKIAIE